MIKGADDSSIQEPELNDLNLILEPGGLHLPSVYKSRQLQEL